MKKKALLCLNDFIQRRLYDEHISKPFITLFKQYADKELKNINDFVYVANAYIKFITINRDRILMFSSSLTRDEFEDDINEIKRVIEYMGNPENRIARNNFVRMVEYFINRQMSVLDVGAGAVPLSSIVLARKKYNITALDKFILSDEFIKQHGVNPIDGYFNEDYDVSKYDMVIGLKPCYAIGHIVSACKKAEKPYFLHLCHCGASDYGLSKFKVLAGNWRYILPEIDKDIKFVNSYATNIDITQEKLSKLVYKKCRFTREMMSSGMIDFMDAFSIALDSLAKGEEKTIQTNSGMLSVSSVSCKESDWKVVDDEYEIEK